MEKIRVAIIDDHKIFREGLKALLNCMENVEVAFEASNGQEFLDKLKETSVQVAIIDINMPVMNGDIAIKQAKAIYKDLKIIVLSMNHEEHQFRNLINIGIDGFIEKESGYHEFSKAFHIILNGNKYFSQDILINSLRKDSLMDLSTRQMEVLKLICLGFSGDEIAKSLFISRRAVEKHRSELLIRTGCTNTTNLLLYALKKGLISL